MHAALSEKLTLTIKSNVAEVTDEEAEVINYGLKCLFSFLIKTILILLISHILGIFNLIIITMICFGFYRTFAGGGHANTHLACFISSSLIFFGSVYIASVISSTYGRINELYLISYLINLLIIYLFAPADVKQKPIMSQKQRRQMRILSLISMSAIILVSIFIKDNTISNLMVIATVLQSISMLPIFYRLVGCEYGCTNKDNSDVRA